MKPRSLSIAVLAAFFAVGAVVLFGQADSVDLSGRWLFTVDTTAGSGTPTITLRQEGEKLTGHYSGQLGEADLTGSVKGQQLEFSFSGEVQGTPFRCTYTGTIENKDSLKGHVNIAGLADGTFTAKRQ